MVAVTGDGGGHGRLSRHGDSSLGGQVRRGQTTPETIDPAVPGMDSSAGPVLIMVRLRPGLVGERRRVCHIATAPPVGSAVWLVTYCGQDLRATDVDVVSFGLDAGAPCNRCQALAEQAAHRIDESDEDTDPDEPVSLHLRADFTGFLRNLAIQAPGLADKIDSGDVTAERIYEFAEILKSAYETATRIMYTQADVHDLGIYSASIRARSGNSPDWET